MLQNTIKHLRAWLIENKTILLLFFLGTIMIALPVLFVERGGGDDTKFLIETHQYTLGQYIVMRYFTWSGRFFGELLVWIVAHIDMKVWKILNILFYLLQSYIIYCYYLIFAQKYACLYKKTDPVALVACLILPFSMDYLAIKDSVFWVTGSSYYLWPVSIGLVGFYPVLRYVVIGSTTIQNKNVQIIVNITSFLLVLCGLVTCEQLGAVFLAFYLLFNIYYIMTQKQISIYLLSQTVLALAFYLFATTAPGVAERIVSETQHYIPDFQSVPLSLKLNYSIRWFFDAVINQMGILLPSIWILLCVFHFKNNKVFNLSDILCTLCFLTGFIVWFFQQSYSTFLFEFQATWGITHFTVSSYFPILFWGIVLVATLIKLIQVGSTLYEKLSYLFVALAIVCSIGIIVFSPTMYASGDRTKYIPAILAILLLFMLYAKLKQRYWPQTTKSPFLLLSVPLCYGLMQYLYTASSFSEHFTIH